MMKLSKNSKGFTLIELLVVVAIIGILAAVGVVAYSGYTSSAKKSAVKANHKKVVKYIMNETMKCSTGLAFAMENNLDCSKQSSNTWKDDVAKAVEIALKDFKNPYDNDPKKKKLAMEEARNIYQMTLMLATLGCYHQVQELKFRFIL